MFASVEMFRLGAEAWVLIEIPDLTPRYYPVFSQIDSQSIVILGGNDSRGSLSNGVVLNAETCAVIKVINRASEIKLECSSQSFMRTPGEIVSLVFTLRYEVLMICYNQADDTITTIQNYDSFN